MREEDIKQTFIKTFRTCFFALVGLMLCICVRIVYLQFYSSNIYSTEDEYKSYTLYPTRGTIFSYDGKPLAISITDNEIYMDLRVQADTLFQKYYKSLADSLAVLFRDRSSKEYQAYLLECRKNRMGYARIGDRNLTYSEVERLEHFPILREGAYRGGKIIQPQEKREMPYGSLARKVIGSINQNGEGSGLEKSFDYRLKGATGERKRYRQSVGIVPVQGMRYTPAEDGVDIRTTIDITIQEAAEKALREQLAESELLEGGTAVVMDVRTGAVRALANLKRMENGKFSESYNYATGHATEPGSTLKLSCLLAMLEDGYATLDTPVSGLNGVWIYGKSHTKFSDTKAGGYGEMTVKTAFEHSSNVAFSQLAVRYYEKQPDAYLERIHAMKLGEKLNLEIGEDAPSVFHSPGDKYWSESTLPMMATGYAVMLTPLHTLTFYNAVANDGKMMKPYLVEAFCRDGKDIETFQPTVMDPSICSKKTITEAKKALRGVVTDGTAKICDDTRYHISGKTGTAQIAFKDGSNMVYKDAAGKKKHQASFAGFFPSEDPKYSCIVVLYSGKTAGNFYGASWAGPVFKKIADKIYASHPGWTPPLESDRYNWAADQEKGNAEYTARNDNVPDGEVPNVRGLGLRDALRLLENKGYQVSFTGTGKVSEQIPEAGTFLAGKEIIKITLQ